MQLCQRLFARHCTQFGQWIRVFDLRIAHGPVPEYALSGEAAIVLEGEAHMPRILGNAHHKILQRHLRSLKVLQEMLAIKNKDASEPMDCVEATGSLDDVGDTAQRRIGRQPAVIDHAVKGGVQGQPIEGRCVHELRANPGVLAASGMDDILGRTGAVPLNSMSARTSAKRIETPSRR